MLRPKLNRIWTSANANLRRDPGDTKYLQGWVSEIPTFQVLNFLQYKVDMTFLALAERGIFEWGNDVQYKLGSIVWDETDSKVYISTVASPSKTTKPSSNLTQWSASSIQVPRSSHDASVAAINAHIADITSNPHKLTASMINAYNKAEIDALVAQYQALVSAHASDFNNPHKLTATQVGAVPVAGGTYTGTVTFNAGVYFDAGKVNTLSVANGFYLQAGNALLGISNSSVPVAGASSATLSPLVTEATFHALKAGREPLFAVPPPDLSFDFNNSIDIRNGNGTCDSNWNPSFDSSTGALVLDNITTQLINGYTMPTIVAGTMVIDVKMSGVDTASDTQHVWMAGNAVQNMYINGANTLFIRTGNTPSYFAVAFQDTNNWHRYAFTFDSTSVKIYIDGVLVQSNAVTGTQTTGATLRIEGASKVAALRRGAFLKNFRVWYSVLTPEQVSTL